MPRTSTALAFLTGILTANTLPHAYAAATGSIQLTPLRGRSSGPRVNGVWSAMNATAALALARRGEPNDTTERRAFAAGVAVFSAWGLLSEWVTDFNGPGPRA